MAAEHWPLVLFVLFLIGLCGLCFSGVLWGPVAAQRPTADDPLGVFERSVRAATRDEDFIDAMRDRDPSFPDPLPMENRVFREYLVSAHAGYMAALRQLEMDLGD